MSRDEDGAAFELLQRVQGPHQRDVPHTGCLVFSDQEGSRRVTPNSEVRRSFTEMSQLCEITNGLNHRPI